VTLLWHYFRRYFGRYRGRLVAGSVALALGQLADVGITILIGNALNRAREASEASWLPRVLVLLLLAAAAHAVMRFFQRWWIVVASRRVEVDLKQELFDQLTHLDFSFHDHSRSGDVVSRLTSDVENLRMFLGPGLMYTAGALVIVPISLAILFTLNAPLAITMVLPIAAMGVAMKLLSPRLHRHSMAVQESLADINHCAQENFGGIRVVKGYDREEQQAARFQATSERNRANQVLLGRARGSTNAAIHGSFELTFVVILALGGLAAIRAPQSFPLGDLFKFVDLTLKIFWPMIALGWIAGMYPRAVASARRVQSLLERRSPIRDPEEPVPLETVRGELTFEEVGFTYGGAQRPALSDVTVHVPAGSTLGVVGPTGCGKTTLLSLLGRLYDVKQGVLRLDGVPIQELSLETLRGALGYVPQDSFLFSEPYRDNVGFGTEEELSDARLAELLERAAMTSEVARFPDGVDTLIGERGVTLSGGQRQRTCIARALAREPRVLLLDDCLSAVDTETEKELTDSLREVGSGCTVVVAAHRLTTVAGADRILVLDADGGVEALGTHEELLEGDGWYRRTWDQQQRAASLEAEL